MLTDEQLLRAYREEHPEAAFAELVARHVDLVIRRPSARRKLQGTHPLKSEG